MFRFQDDDDIFGLNDAPPAKSAPAKKPVEDTMDWLEMATGGRTLEKTVDKPSEKAALKSKPAQKPAETKPSTAPAKSSKADWLGLKDSDDEDGYDVLKASSFSAPTRQGQPTVCINLLVFYDSELKSFISWLSSGVLNSLFFVKNCIIKSYLKKTKRLKFVNFIRYHSYFLLVKTMMDWDKS